MIVVVPYVEGMLHPRVVPAIERQGYRPCLYKVGPGRTSYARLLAALWRTVDDHLMVVEQDVESRTGLLDDLARCREPYCFHPYGFSVPFDEAGGQVTPLGHTRFRQEVFPMLRELGRIRQWYSLDYLDCDRIIAAHLASSISPVYPHRHEGSVIHHHDYAR